ncbi:MAG: pyridoxal phosphate-dependent decarboxylase family protein [Anaerovoracaceae bacterium]
MNNINEKYDAILKELDAFAADDPSYKDGKTWSLVYYKDEEYTKFLLAAYEKFFSANGLNPGAFKSLKRLEKEVLKFTAEILGGDDSFYGSVTSGGTESCLLALKTYRDMGRAKGKKRPEMIISETGHVAWFKAAEYFGVKTRIVPVLNDLTMDVAKVEKLINRNTIMILGSAPEYPHGLIDPIEDLGKIAEKRNVPLHVDACLGGYMLPFLKDAVLDMPKWDFSVPGVSSISADTHKYGYAAKGASTILYRDEETFKHQVYVNQNWPGGVFASAGILGTRPGGSYGAAWAAINFHGIDGYTKLAEETLAITNEMKERISDIEGLKILGNPKSTIFSFTSEATGRYAKNGKNKNNSANNSGGVKKINIFAVADIMEEKGWLIDRIQRPDALHAMVTINHKEVIDKYIEDLTEAVKTVRANPRLGRSGQAATYGMISKVPLRKVVKKQVLNIFAKSYKISGGDIDLG